MKRCCPFSGCTTLVHPSLFCCRKHWSGLSSEQRARAYKLYKLWLACKITPDRLLHEQTKIVAEAEQASYQRGLFDSLPNGGAT